jgi:sec-independent protein translocase protein TatA
MPTPLPLQFGIPGGPELLIILFIAILLFGANKLPELARSSGQAMGEFKRGRQELEDELKRGVEDGTDDSDLSADAPVSDPDSET